MIDQRISIVCIAVYIELAGILLGNWVVRIPEIKSHYELSDGEFGLILILSMGGGLASFLFSLFLSNYYQSSKGSLFGAILMLVFTPLLGNNGKGVILLCVGLFGWGFGWGILDVMINTQSSLHEKLHQINCMGLFHANYSVGSMLGGIIGGIMAKLGINPFTNFIVNTTVLTPFILLCYFGLYGPIEERTAVLQRRSDVTTEEIPLLPLSGGFTEAKDNDICRHSGRPRISQLSLLLPICMMMFVSAICEGSMYDWTSIYLKTSLGFSSTTTSYIFSMYSIVLAVGRFYSDELRYHMNTSIILQISGFFTFAGLLFLSSASIFMEYFVAKLLLSILGMFLTGCGVSVCYPVLTSSAGQLHISESSQSYNANSGLTDVVTSATNQRSSNFLIPDSNKSVLAITAAAYLGYLIGPPLFGGLSTLFGGLPWVLFVDGCFSFTISILSYLTPDMQTLVTSRPNHSSPDAMSVTPQSAEVPKSEMSAKT